MHVGVDLGSRSIKLVAMQDGRLVEFEVAESGFEPHEQARKMVERFTRATVAATGYGRHMAKKHFAQTVLTEIRAHAIGARYHHPGCRTILDVGGQDSKVISLGAGGEVIHFQMNDKCAAGTGRFLEMMAGSLGYALGEFGEAAAGGGDALPINSMCAVFAESEVVSLKNRGSAPRDIALSVHLSVVERLAVMLERAGLVEPLVFTGGVANNPTLVELLRRRLAVPVHVPESPEIVGALGAALSISASASPGSSAGGRVAEVDGTGRQVHLPA